MLVRTVKGWFVEPSDEERRYIASVVELSRHARRRTLWDEEMVLREAILLGLRFLSEALEQRVAETLQGGDAPPSQRPKSGPPSRG
jgi:hypothetical protein